MAKLTYIGKLHNAIETCKRLTEPMRAKRALMLEEYANGYFGNNLDIAKKPLNMVYRAMSVMIPLLASNNPKVMVRPRISQLKPLAETFRLTLNHIIEEIEFRRTLRGAVTNSMMYMGITKTGVTNGGPQVEDAFGYLHDAGQIYWDNVDGDDYVWDVVGRVREEFDFEGNRYRVPLEYIADSGLFKNYDGLKPVYAECGEKEKRPEKIAKETIHNFEISEIRPYVELYDIWIPSENSVMTIAPDGQGDKPLREVEYEGPESGPYDTLAYHTFPESIVPIPPIFAWLDLHHYINTFARKMARQAEREKTLLAYSGQAEDDARTVVGSSDGEAVRVDSVDQLKEIKFGGVNDAAYQYIGQLKQWWSEMAGNMDLIGGLRPQAETLGQEQMLQANATISIEDMVWQVHNFSKSVLKKMAWHIWTDPLIDVTVSKRIPGVAELDVKFSPEAREGDFIDYELDIEPYSTQRMSPAIRMQKVMQLVTGIIEPFLPMAAQQGIQIDLAGLVKLVAKDMDLTNAEVDEIFKTMLPTETGLGPYQPMQGQVQSKSGQASDRFGASPASKAANSNQQQTSTRGGKPSPPQK